VYEGQVLMPSEWAAVPGVQGTGGDDDGEPKSWRQQAERLVPAGSGRQQHAAWHREPPRTFPLLTGSVAMPALLLLLAAALVAWVSLGGDLGPAPAPLSTAAVLVTSALAPKGSQFYVVDAAHAAVTLHSSVVGVDLEAGTLQLMLQLAHSRGACPPAATAAPAATPVLLVGGTSPGAPQASLRLCTPESELPHMLTLPLQAQGRTAPLDEHAADISLQLAHSPGGRQRRASPTQRKPRRWRTTAGSVAWSATWAAPGVQLSVERKLGLHARLVAGAAGGARVDGDGGAGSSLLDRLTHQLHADSARQGALVYSVRVARAPWLRILHLAAALVQLAAFAWACLQLLGACLCALVLERFLCHRLRT
jgi:hypothetical protein